MVSLYTPITQETLISVVRAETETSTRGKIIAQGMRRSIRIAIMRAPNEVAIAIIAKAAAAFMLLSRCWHPNASVPFHV